MPLISFASPKGGVGKTTLAANVADALHRQGRRVVLIDLDPQNTLRLHFGVSLTDGIGFMTDLPRRAGWRHALRTTPSGLLLLPHGGTDLPGALALARLLEREPELLLTPLREMLADPDLLVIADTAPGATPALALLAPMSTLLIAVMLADATSAALVPEISSGRFLGTGAAATALDVRLRVVLNQVDMEQRLSRAAAEAVIRLMGPRVIGAVARDQAIAEAVACQCLLLDFAPTSLAAEDLREIARGIDAALPTATGRNEPLRGLA
ncbi:AAA family ATPase [Roseomonas sp. NAR14]|uniref:AAA family ATPase n=1 Tax=Roseomonas acroporae TaxID=2937791 RepID=A0A9X2BWW2_9PROT|nr:cellulose synthase operon protein YhjQ/BcsQ [Roseomonas acroporae]MCK8784320.1 AAA family ATPase [Roseomonas acroporae]